MVGIIICDIFAMSKVDVNIVSVLTSALINVEVNNEISDFIIVL